jgi:hypothetical protein
LVVPFLSACLVAACTTAVKPSSSSSTNKQAASGSDQFGGGNNDTATPPGSLGGGPGAPSSCSGGNTQGCPCTAGTTAACWTGPAEDRNVGACHDGTQTCVSSGQGELTQSTWGPCEGQVLQCGQNGADASPPPAPSEDAGVDSAPVMVVTVDSGPAAVADAASGFLVAQNASAGGGVSPCSVQCTGCVPGAVIGCYDDCNLKAYCDTTATQTCLPNGTWGACTETGSAPLTAQCYEFWGNCSNYNNGAGSYAGQCDSVFTGCASPLSTTCPGSTDTSQLGAGAPDIPGSTGPGPGPGGLGGTGSACEASAGFCLPAGSGATECGKIGGTVSMTSCTGSSSGGTVCCLFGGR